MSFHANDGITSPNWKGLLITNYLFPILVSNDNLREEIVELLYGYSSVLFLCNKAILSFLLGVIKDYWGKSTENFEIRGFLFAFFFFFFKPRRRERR